MTDDQITRLRALTQVDADPVRVSRADLADMLDALDDAREAAARVVRERHDLRLALDIRNDTVAVMEANASEGAAAYIAVTAERDALREAIEDAYRVLNLAPSMSTARLVAERLETLLHPERFTTATATVTAGPRDADGREVTP